MTTNPYVPLPLDFTFAPFGSLESCFAPPLAQTPLSPPIYSTPAAIAPSRIKALQAIPDQVLNEFFEGLFKALSAAATQFSNGSTCTGDTIADISFLLRVLMPEAVGTEAVGITTGENLFRGAWAALKAWKRFQAAQAIGDKGGMIEGGMDASRGIFQSIGGGFYLGYRGLMIAADVHQVNAGFNATTALGKAAFSVGTIGNIFFTLFYVAITAWSAYELSESVGFSQKFSACKTDEELIAFLEKKVHANPMAKLNGLTPKEAEEKFSSGILDALTDLLHAGMESFKPEDEASASRDEVKQLLKDLFAVKGEELKKSSIYKEMISSLGLQKGQCDFSILGLLGFKLEALKHQRRKDAKFSRVAGGAVKKAFDRGLGPRFASDNPLIKESAEVELAKLKEDVASANTKNNVIMGVLLAIGVLGLASSGLGFLPVLSAAALTALIAVTLLLCLGMLGADGYFMYKGWGSGEPGKYDKHYIAFLSVMIVTILAISIGTTLGFGLPLFPLIFAGIFGAVSLGLCGVAMDELIYKEKKWKAEHPDLEVFYKSLSNSVNGDDEFLDEKVTLLFKMLPKSNRHAIRKKYFEMGKELPLKNGEYKKLDNAYDFGGAYFYAQITPGAMNNEIEHKLLLRGIKKTLNFYWKKWAIEKTEESKMIALQAQALFEAVSRKNAEAIKAAVVNKQGYFAQLKADLWYVVKREESKKDLMRIVKIVESEQKAASVQQKAPNLCEHTIGILSPHNSSSSLNTLK